MNEIIAEIFWDPTLDDTSDEISVKGNLRVSYEAQMRGKGEQGWNKSEIISQFIFNLAFLISNSISPSKVDMKGHFNCTNRILHNYLNFWYEFLWFLNICQDFEAHK